MPINSITQAIISNRPPTGVIRAIDLKSKLESEFVASPYIEPEKKTTPNKTK